jgi:hypothetical protein
MHLVGKGGTALQIQLYHEDGFRRRLRDGRLQTSLHGTSTSKDEVEFACGHANGGPSIAGWTVSKLFIFARQASAKDQTCCMPRILYQERGRKFIDSDQQLEAEDWDLVTGLESLLRVSAPDHFGDSFDSCRHANNVNSRSTSS